MSDVALYTIRLSKRNRAEFRSAENIDVNELMAELKRDKWRKIHIEGWNKDGETLVWNHAITMRPLKKSEHFPTPGAGA